MSDNDGTPMLLREAFRHARRDNIDEMTHKAKIIVVGTGGAGCNTVDRMMTIGIKDVICIACNTDNQHLRKVKANRKILLGPATTKGLGAGGFPQVGAAAAEESRDEIKNALSGADLVFITAGMGGGTGTGSAPIIAQIAKEEIGAIIVGVVTMPFSSEKTRIEKAKIGLNQLRKYCDTVVVIENDKLKELYGSLPVREAFSLADEILAQMVRGITEIIFFPSQINLDFADIRAILQGGGVAMVGIGEAKGEAGIERARQAIENALSRPLLEVDITGAQGALVHVTGGRDMLLDEAESAASLISEKMDDDANIIWGVRTDPAFNGYLRVILIVTGVQSPNILGPTVKVPVRKAWIPLGGGLSTPVFTSDPKNPYGPSDPFAIEEQRDKKKKYDFKLKKI